MTLTLILIRSLTLTLILTRSLTPTLILTLTLTVIVTPTLTLSLTLAQVMELVEDFKTDAGFLKEAMGRLGDLLKMDGKNRAEALEKPRLTTLIGVMKAHTNKLDLMELMFATLRAILDDPANDIAQPAAQQANGKTREIANKMGITKQVTKYVADNAAASAKQRSLGLLTEGMALLIVLAPLEGDLDPKAGDAVLTTMLADPKDLNLQQLGLVYFVQERAHKGHTAHTHTIKNFSCAPQPHLYPRHEPNHVSTST